jgi:hypothetical protein
VKSLSWDEKLRRLPLPSNVTYMSLKNLLLHRSGCMTRSARTFQTDLIVKDSLHLTAMSSAFLTRKLISKVIP